MNNIQLLRSMVVKIDQDNLGYLELLKHMTNSRFVLMGEASHGTTEFYRDRSYLTKKLIQDYGFNAVIIEGDWPDAYQITKYVVGTNTDITAKQALSGFERFPTWMWRNQEMLEFIEWLHDYNHSLEGRSASTSTVPVFGMDLYSLFTSMDEVIEYLQKFNVEMGSRARQRFSCFDHFNRDSQLYGYMTSYNNRMKSCEREVMDQLLEIVGIKDYVQSFSEEGLNEYFSILQNSRLIKNAEKYYRNMFGGNVSSWNLRDAHMFETIKNVDQYFLSKLNIPPRIIIWAHNSHIGNAGFTQQGSSGETNIGQLMRNHYPKDVFLLGFTTYEGNVTAATEWGGPIEYKKLNRAIEGSIEYFFHQLGIDKFYLPIKENPKVRDLLPTHILERAVGVVYFPESERLSHYFYVDIANQFDAIIHIDKTTALKPLDIPAKAEDRDFPDTYPSGL